MGFVAETFLAGLLASLACGLGAVPLVLVRRDALDRRAGSRIGLGYAAAGGLMLAASFYNLLLPGVMTGPDGERTLDLMQPWPVTQLSGGLLLGAAMIWAVGRWVTPERLAGRWLRTFGGRASALVFLSMAFHSIPEGLAVGVGFGAEENHASLSGMGVTIALAIAIHNMPEGLAVALPLRAEGASIGRCFVLATATSLPQPVAAVPASLAVWLFEPLMLPFLGFAAGAMIYLVFVELIPEALVTQPPSAAAWAVMTGFVLMTLVQIVL